MTGWQFRKAIIIDGAKVKSVTNFPVLIDIFSSRLASAAKSNGDDILFADSGGSKLSHQIESYDNSTGHLIAWVKVPSLSAESSKLIYMYYGNPSAGNQQNPSAVWDSNFKLVQHFNEKSGNHIDSTSSHNDGVPYSVIQGASGKIDGADIFDGSSSYIEVPHDNSISGFTKAFTASFWIKPGGSTWTNQTITNKYNATNNQKGWLIEYRYPSTIVLNASSDGITDQMWFCTLSSSTDGWYYVTVIWQANKVPQFYINGKKFATSGLGTIPNIWNNIGVPLRIGKSFKGIIDEVRISSVARSSNWITTDFNNQQNPSSFYTIGSEQEYPQTPASSTNENPPDGSVNVYTNPTLSVNVTDSNGNPVDIFFRANASGTWEEVGIYRGVNSGTYSIVPKNMGSLGTKYHWMVSVTDGTSWNNKTYSFTTTTKVFQSGTYKWRITGLAPSKVGVLIADVTGDEAEEIIRAGQSGSSGNITVHDGTTGKMIWGRLVDGTLGDLFVQAQMADLNRDGILEVIVPLARGIEVLFGNNGSTYWRYDGLPGGAESPSSPVVADIDGDGYPTIFHITTDYSHGLNGSGRIIALSHDGKLLYQSFAYRPCAGGLSIADTDGDGEFEVYVGERDMYYVTSDIGFKDNNYGKGMRSFWAKNLTLRWEHPDVLMSSNRPMIADVDKDGIQDVIGLHHKGGIAILNSKDGSAIYKNLAVTIKDSTGTNKRLPVHYQSSLYDIDDDGHLEVIVADGEHAQTDSTTSKDVVIWDLIDHNYRVISSFRTSGLSMYGPQLADVTGDGKMDIIVCANTGVYIYTYNSTGRTYDLIDKVTGLNPGLRYATAQDIDGDGYTELVVPSTNTLYAFDTPARAPTPRARSEVQFHSEYRRGAAEYVPPPGRSAPLISDPSPSDGATDVSISLPELSFNLTDFQYDRMNYTVTTSPDIGSDGGVNAGYSRYSVSINGLEPSTTYVWHVNVTDGAHWTNITYAFTTEASVISRENPKNRTVSVPLSLSQLSFNLSDPNGERMNYVVTTYPDIGSGSGFNATNGRYNVPVSGLSYGTTYVWHVNVTDSISWTNRTYTFTTETNHPPTQNKPVLTTLDGNLVAYNQSTFDADGDKVTNIYDWYVNGSSITKLVLPFDINDNVVAKDYSGYGNDGTVIRATWTSEGVVGGAYYFSGTHPDGGYIEVPHSSSLDGNGMWSEITVEHWIYLMSNNYETRTIAKVPSYEIGITTARKVFVSIWTPTETYATNYKVTYNTALDLNKWYHVAFTYKSGVGIKLYVNGVLKASSATITGNIQRSSGQYSGILEGGDVPVYIGWHDYFHGYVDEVRIYNRALSQKQIEQRYKETKDGLSSSSTIVPNETTVGDIWRVEVTPTDSHKDGIRKSSNTVMVGYNNKPSAENVAITPTTPRTNDNLTASYTYFDPDSDPESGTEIRWYKNDILQPELNNTRIVSFSLTTEGDVWYFTVRPCDGKEFGETVASPRVTILGHIITASAGSGGSIDPSGAVSVDYGSDQSFTITADPHYHILDVLVDGVSVGVIGSYTFTAVDKDHTITALFELDQYTIIASAGSGGSIDPSGWVSANYGEDKKFTITAGTGYHILDVLVDGVSLGAVAEYTFPSVAANHTIEVTFSLNQYAITASAGSDGTISPSGSVLVAYGSDQSFTITADSDYHILDVLVDGVSVGVIGSYTFTAVDKNHTITASFAFNQYVITASAGAGGTIVPSDSVFAANGEDKKFTITAGTGYHILDVLVDGVSVGPVPSYIFTSVDKNHTITASFELNEYTLSVTIDGSGNVTKTPWKQTYHYGDVVELTATAGSGWSFSHWGGDLSGNDNPLTFIIYDDKVATAVFTQNLEPNNWWNTDWKYRRSITIDRTKVSADQTDFPVLIDLTDSSLTAKAQVDGDDFVFADPNHSKLSHEIESYNGGTGHLVAWVKVPVLSSTVDTVLYMYYGNPSCGSQQDPTAVWDTSYKLVLHLDEKTGTHYDSTVNDNDGTPYNGLAQGVAGKVDGADTFDGVNDYIAVPHSNTLAIYSEGFTSSFWLRLDDVTGRRALLSKDSSTTGQRSWFIEYQNHATYGRVLGLLVSKDGSSTKEWFASFNPTVDVWYYVTVAWQPGVVPKFYINGAQVSTITTGTVSSIYNNDVALYIGRWNTARYLKGGLDEIRISNPVRSAAYILTSNNSQGDPTTFYRIGTEEEYYTLTVNVVGSGYVTKTPNRAVYTFGETVELTATANEGWAFAGWSGDLTDSENPIVIVMNGDKVVNATFTLENRQPIIERYTPEDLTPEVYEGGSINFNQTSSDPDNDALFYSWILDNTLQATSQNWTYMPSFNEAGFHNVTLVVSDGQLNASIQWDVTVIDVNRIPSAPVVEITPAEPLTKDDLMCVITTESVDSDGDLVAYIYQWYKDDVLQPELTTNTVSHSLTSKGERWKCVVTPFDDKDYGPSAEAEVTIQNSPPSIDAYAPTESLPSMYEGESLIFNHTSSDPDGGFLSHSWVLDDAPQADTQNWTYTPGFDQESFHNVTLVVSDGQLNTSIQWNVTVIDVNRLPSEPMIEITPNEPLTEDDLVCVITAPGVDPEGDSVTYIYQWYKNDELQWDLTNDTVPHNLTSKGETWRCIVTPFDGKDNGTSAEDETVILNTSPQIDTCIPVNASPSVNEGESLEFTHTSSDPDNDTLTYSWLLDDVSQSTSQNWTYAPDYESAGTHNVTLVISDPESAVSQYWDVSVINVNRAPYIQSCHPETDPTISEGEYQEFNITYYDPDGETETVQWYLNGTPTVLTDSYIFEANYTSAGTCNVTVTVTDGLAEDSHTWALTVLENEPPEVSSLTISPSSPLTTDDLVGNYAYYDADGDSDSGTEIRWYLNDTLQPLLNNTLVVPADLTSKGDVWLFTVRPKDGKGFGNLQTSPTVIIQNSAPNATNLLISPSSPYTSDNLTATYTYYDADAEPESGTEIRWYKDGALQSDYNDKLEIPSSATTKDETWNFTVRPKDGTDYGELQISPKVTIQNSPPTIETHFPLENPTINVTQSQEFNVTCSDLDGDTLTFNWTVNENPVGTGGNSYAFNATEWLAGTYIVKVIVSDGEKQTSYEWTLTVTP